MRHGTGLPARAPLLGIAEAEAGRFMGRAVTLATPVTCATPMTAPGLDDDDAAALAGLFGALADPGASRS
jgi:hypothetical protein